MNLSGDQYRKALEALFDGPLPAALEGELSALSEGTTADDLDALLEIAAALDSYGDTLQQQTPTLNLWPALQDELEDAHGTPLFLDDERIGSYLDDALLQNSRIAFEADLADYPHLAEELRASLELKHELLAMGPHLQLRMPSIDVVEHVQSRAASLAAEAFNSDDDLHELGATLEQMGESIARSLSPVDLEGEVMAAVRAGKNSEETTRIVPLTGRKQRHQGDWQRWGLLAATFAMMAAVGVSVYLAGYRSGQGVQHAMNEAPTSAAPAPAPVVRSDEDSFSAAAEPKLPGETHVVASEEQRVDAPGPRSTSRRKDTTWEDVLNARRNAITDKSALEKLQQWASLSREEILDLLEEDGLDPEVIAGAAQFLPPEEAVALLEDLVQKYPDDPYFRAALARNLAASGDSVLAQQHLSEWADLEPGNGLPRYMEANLRFAEGDVEGGLEALYLASSANYANPHSVAAAYERESALIAAGYDRDTARFLAALSAGSNESQELSQLGQDFGRYAQAYAENGDFDSAEQVALGIVNLGQQMARSAQTTNDFASGVALQQEGLAALSGLYALFGIENPNLLSQLTAEVVAGLNQLNTMLQQLNAVMNSPDLQLINSLLDLIMQGAELTFFAP